MAFFPTVGWALRVAVLLPLRTSKLMSAKILKGQLATQLAI